MKLIKFPLSNITGKEISLPNNIKLIDETENVITSLPYLDWEIDEIIENFSEDEQDLLIEKISVLVESWELTLDAELEALLQRRYKESKTNLNYVDWLYDLAQEKVYRAYAIEQLDKQKNKVASLTTLNAETNQTSTGSNSSIGIISTNRFSTINESVKTIAPAATPTASNTAINFDNSLYSDAATNQSNINSNCLLDEEQQINQIIENLSENEQDALIEKTVLLLDEWESTKDEGLKLALKTQHQKHQPNIPYQDFLYELAQSQVYREYAIEQLELPKQSNFAIFIEPFTQIEQVYFNTTPNVNVDELNIDGLTFNEPVFNVVNQDAKDESSVQLLEANNYTFINNDGLATSSNSDIFTREKPIFDDASQGAKENAVNKISLDCHQANVSSNQGHQNEINKPLIVSNYDYHITKTSPSGYCKLTTKYINQQSSNVSSSTHLWKKSLLIKPKQALLMHVHQGKATSIHHPPSMPP